MAASAYPAGLNTPVLGALMIPVMVAAPGLNTVSYSLKSDRPLKKKWSSKFAELTFPPTWVGVSTGSGGCAGAAPSIEFHISPTDGGGPAGAGAGAGGLVAC